jgi:hypothetical protein
MIHKSGCGAVGSVLRSGRRGRKFESSHPDHKKVHIQLYIEIYELDMNRKNEKRSK